MRGRESKRAVRKPRAHAPTRPPATALPGGSRGTRVFVPQGYERGYDYPLLVWLPDPAARFDLGRAMRGTSLRNFVAVQPDAGADTEARVWHAIDHVRDRWSIHPRRIHLVGCGRGGSEAFRIGCRAPESFAGIVSLGGPFPLDTGLFARAAHVRRLPMLLCLTRDTVAADPTHADRVLRLFHAAGALLSLRIYPGHDDLARAPLADVNRWVMEGICGTAADLPARCSS